MGAFHSVMWCWMWDRRSLGFPLSWPCSAPKGLTLSWQEVHLPEPGITLLLKVKYFCLFCFLKFWPPHEACEKLHIFPLNTDGITISSDPHQPESNQFHPQPCWMGSVFKRRPFSPHKTRIHSILLAVTLSSLAVDGSWISWRGPKMLCCFHARPGPTPQFQKAYWNSRLNVKRRASNPLYHV